MNLENSEPHPVAGESSLQSSRRANKRRRHDPNGAGDERDGQKWPLGKVEIRPFACPFCKLDPYRFADCRGHRLNRLWDVIQHISRQHLILEVGFESGKRVREQDIVVYCTRCRCLFHGVGASEKRDNHMNQGIECQQANIEQTGVMLIGEFEGLKRELRLCPQLDGKFRWNIIWIWCFPEKPYPSSPYVEILPPKAEVQSIIQKEFASIPGFDQEEAQLRARHCTTRIYNTESEPRTRPSVPPQAQSNIMQTTPVSNYHALPYLPSNSAFNSRPLQQQTQGVHQSSGLPFLGVYGTPTGGQSDNSAHWNNTLINNSAPSRPLGSGAHTASGINFADSGHCIATGSGYPPFPYIRNHTESFSPEYRGDGHLNTHRNATGR